MTSRFGIRWTWMVSAALWGCGGGGDDGRGGASGDTRDAEPTLADVGAGGHGTGQGGEAGGGGAGHGGGPGGSGPGGGQAGHGGEAGHGGSGGSQPPGPPVEDCAQACTRYGECDRLDRVGGDEAACLDLCASVPGGRQSTWFSCLSRSACGALGACAVPQAPPPGCLEVCESASACRVELPGCADLCADAAGEDAVAACGRHVTGGACDADAFTTCLVGRIAPACETRCSAQAPCAGGTPAACARQCLADVASADPLAQARLADELACYARSPEGACDAIAACAAGPARFAEPPTLDTFCRRWSACQWDFDSDCVEAYHGLIAYGDHLATLFCFDGYLDLCTDFYTAYDNCVAMVPPDPRCAGLCAGVEACGLALAGDASCEATCDGASEPYGHGRVAAQVECVAEGHCAELGDCLAAGSPEGQCEPFCRLADVCGLPQAGADCPAECAALVGRPREDVRRACVVGSGDDCAAAAECALPPPVNCDAYCQRYGDCGYEVLPSCVGDCEAAALANPASAVPLIDCIVASPTCDGWAGDTPSVSACYDEPWRGQACSAFCRQADACPSGGVEGSAECLARCGAGLAGEDALRLDLGRDCINGIEPYPTCEAIDACIPPTLDIDCAAFCDTAAGCGVELGDCERACAEDALGRVRAVRGSLCLADVDACEGVTACLVHNSAPVAPPTREAFCDLWNGCGYDFDWGPCDWAYDDSESYRPGAAACMVQRMRQGCGDPFTTFDECTYADGPTPCDDYCDAQSACHPDAGPRADCLDACLRPLSADEALRVAPVQACGTKFSCGAFDACVEHEGPAGQCSRFCDSLGACGLADDGAACAAECDAQFPRARDTAWRVCVDAAPADCEAVAACEPPAPPPCRDACARAFACGLEWDAAACTAGCEDAAVTERVSTTLHVGCVLGASGCIGATDSVEACYLDPAAGSALCLSWCRLVDDCDPDSARTLDACALECALGFTPAEGLRLGAASECLLAAGPDAPCGTLRDCRIEPPAPDCAALCGQSAECGFDAPDCPATCAAAPEILAGCLAESDRLNRRCGGIAACFGYVAPPAPPACVAYCGAVADCDGSPDRFLCERQCAADPEADVWPIRAACLAAAGCREAAACAALDDSLSPVCAAPCRTAQACGAFESQPACEAHCTGFIRSRAVSPDYIPQINQCLAEIGAPGACVAEPARACFQKAQGNCEAFCDDQIACQWWYFPGDEAFCRLDCEDRLQFDPDSQELAMDCTARFMSGQCDIDGFVNCTGGF